MPAPVFRALQIAVLALGIVLLVALVRAVGVDVLRAHLQGFGVAFAGVVALELVLDGCFTLGWRRTLPRAAIGFWRLFWVREAGTAVNQLTPTATVGGEVVKAMLLRGHVPANDAVVSIVATKLAFALGQTAFVLVGLAAVIGRGAAAPGTRAGLIGAAAIACAAVGGFLVAQRRGVLAPAVRVATRLGVRARWLAPLEARAERLDRELATLHRERPGAFAASVAWHFGGQLVGVLQLLYILVALGVPADLLTCVGIEALALLADSAVFFVPGRVGVQEGGRVLVFTILGLGAGTGLAVALIVRLNQLTVAALGLVAFGYFSLTTAPATGSINET